MSELKALDAAIADIHKKYGAGAIMKMSDRPSGKIDVISSGSLSVNVALGIGGYPRGRIVEIFGWESSGKTTLALHAIAECQAAGGVAAIIDAEHAMDPEYAANLGVDVNALLISQPDNAEQALEICEMLTRTGDVTMIVVDSVAALVPQSEINGDMGDSNMGVIARLMSQAMRKLVPVANKSSTTLVFINQLREKIGVVFGNPTTTPGGNALKFYASIRIEVSRASQPGKDEAGQAVSSRTKVKVIKNKMAPPFKIAEFDVVYGKGINRLGEVFDIAVAMGLISKAGSYYSYDENKLGQGRDACLGVLSENPDLVEELETMVMKSMANGAVMPVSAKDTKSSGKKR